VNRAFQRRKEHEKTIIEVNGTSYWRNVEM